MSHGFHAFGGIPLLRGRLFDDSDRSGSLPVILISAAAARQWFPDVDPIGRRVNLTPKGAAITWHMIVGIVGNVRSTAIEPSPGLYVYGSLPYRSRPKT